MEIEKEEKSIGMKEIVIMNNKEKKIFEKQIEKLKLKEEIEKIKKEKEKENKEKEEKIKELKERNRENKKRRRRK
jgi:hypothetical protein